jgi:hypothetical protein
MIFQSIRWRLQIWYGLILAALLAGFGFTAYRLEHNRVIRQVDEELRFCVDALAGFFRGPVAARAGRAARAARIRARSIGRGPTVRDFAAACHRVRIAALPDRRPASRSKAANPADHSARHRRTVIRATFACRRA